MLAPPLPMMVPASVLETSIFITTPPTNAAGIFGFPAPRALRELLPVLRPPVLGAAGRCSLA